ncbi:very-long-chain enoyl-CoA reductase isoform X1 [Falco cherrug]|uniref:very-long-chain enoyl-CoA reductase isoform X1 n=1 Tax=Falco cherrug TaxID=345164 RepID=UPI002478B4EC|nr:very-long-chain enoyl-CoA reductase isoform X1 [Falco cherrug]XP_055580913.1 very-long-chain enoyl-CoA reductase isoform X1 [Falco cherrug]XP_055671529.1 very-long-chain enoyl-CoA reductase isoform X1 [Falco peregrinus]XP_055671530.1 very-long-chain enoyl-CoA reductase isoform X1 [Falco peregrinus]
MRLISCSHSVPFKAKSITVLKGTPPDRGSRRPVAAAPPCQSGHGGSRRTWPCGGPALLQPARGSAAGAARERLGQRPRPRAGRGVRAPPDWPQRGARGRRGGRRRGGGGRRMGGRAGFFEVEILDWKTKKQLCFLDKVEPNATIREIRLMFHKFYPRWYPARQSLKLDPKGKSLRDEEILQHLPVGTTATLYFKDLGPQIGWTTVFLIEYTGPLFIYFLFYFRMPFVYGLDERFTSSPHPVVNLACICHSFHYIKRLIETVFVHRFSHGTMPLRNIVKNCLYYWGFAAWLAYYINHPLYTPPSYGKKQINFAVIMFLLCEAGNFSIHVALSDLRRNGSKTRKIPYPTKNPFTWLFFFVSCPNYTYEVGTWISFTIMTQCVPVGLFTLLCFIQMTIWAKDKHCTYLREFKDYPSLRMPIIPFLL